MVFNQVFSSVSQISKNFSSCEKKYPVLLLILLLNVCLIAQDSTDVYQWTPTNKGQNNNPFLLIGGDDNKMITVFQERKREVSIRSYDYNTLEEEVLSFFEFDDQFSKEESFIEAFFMNEKIYFFVEEFTYKEKSQKLYAMVFNINSKEFSERTEIDYLEKGKNNRRGKFIVRLNNDSSHYIVTAIDPWHKKEKKKFSSKYYSLNNDLIWQNDFSLPYGSAYTKLNQIKADNNGNLHIGVQVSPERGGTEAIQIDQSELKFILLSYFPEKKKIKETDLNLGDKWIADMAFDLSSKDEIVISGFYSKDRFNSIGGSFYLRLNSKDLAIQASAFYPLSKEAVVDLIGEKRSDKGKEIPRVELRHIVVNENGSCTIVGEQFWMRERNDYNMTGGFFTRQVYYFMDLILIRYQPDGELTWEKVVPKRQESINDEGLYSSIALANKDDEIFIVFNDDEKNVELINDPDKNSLRNFNVLKSDPSYVRVDAEGNLTRLSPFKGKKGQFKLRPLDSMQCSRNRLAILASRNGLERFCLFELE